MDNLGICLRSNHVRVDYAKCLSILELWLEIFDMSIDEYNIIGRKIDEPVFFDDYEEYCAYGY